MPGSIEFACDQTTIPTEDRLGLGDTGYLGEELATEAFADFSKRTPLGVGEPDISRHVRAKDSILCDQVFALEEQALIHQARDVCQQPRPAVVLHGESI